MDASLLELDPTITADQAAAARDASPIDYDVIFAEITARLAQDTIVDHDEPDDLARGLVTLEPALPRVAIANARATHENNTNVGIGFCLQRVRLYFGVPALWPDAETQWEHGGILGKTRHHETDPAKHPRGSVGYAINGRHGHVWLNVGGGLCWTTDFVRPGFVDLAPIAKMAPWIGGTLVGWAEILEGYDVWPSAEPKPKPVFDLVDRQELVHHALLTARHNNAPHYRIEGLREWDDRLKARLAAKAGH